MCRASLMNLFCNYSFFYGNDVDKGMDRTFFRKFQLAGHQLSDEPIPKYVDRQA